MPWNQDLSVGVDLIDEQHKMCFEKAEALFEAGRNHRAKEYIGEMLDFLSDYTQKHFSDEEKYMLSIQYPGYAEQKKEHEAFIVQMVKLKEDYEASGGSLMVILNANQMVVTWLTKHIGTLDKKIGQFARQKQA